MALYPSYQDEKLVALLKLGDHRAFTEIFNRYNSLMYGHVANKLRDASEARDIVQDIFIKLWEKRAEVDEKGNLAGFLYTMARNQVFNLIKHKHVVSEYAGLFSRINEESSEAATDHLIREKQFAAMIQAEIEALPPRMRQVFELRRIENLSNKEVALRLGITEHTAADQMKKATKILKTKIGLVLILAAFINNAN